MRRLHLALSCASSTGNSLSLRPIVSDAIQPPPLWSSSPSFPWPLRHHHSLAYVFVFSSQYMPIHLQSTFLHFLGYFSHLRRPSNSFSPNYVQLGDSTLSATSNFFSCVFFTAHVSAPYIIAGVTTVLYTLPLTLKLILRSHRIPDPLFQFLSILIGFYASSPHPNLHYLPMSLLGI